MGALEHRINEMLWTLRSGNSLWLKHYKHYYQNMLNSMGINKITFFFGGLSAFPPSNKYMCFDAGVDGLAISSCLRKMYI